MQDRDEANKGKRVILIEDLKLNSYSNDVDSFTKLRKGAQGTYLFSWKDALFESEGIIKHKIKWDNGSNLTLLGGIDKFKFVGEE